LPSYFFFVLFHPLYFPFLCQLFSTLHFFVFKPFFSWVLFHIVFYGLIIPIKKKRPTSFPPFSSFTSLSMCFTSLWILTIPLRVLLRPPRFLDAQDSHGCLSSRFLNIYWDPEVSSFHLWHLSAPSPPPPLLPTRLLVHLLVTDLHGCEVIIPNTILFLPLRFSLPPFTHGAYVAHCDDDRA